jgi:hypothetical protein
MKTLRNALAAVAVTLLASCAGPQTQVTNPLDATADAPYRKILVVTLFSSFDARRYLEQEIVRELGERGVSAVRSTSMMDTRTPLVRQTFIDMIEEVGADALLLTQLTQHDMERSEADARPQATYNYWPTWYFNVFAVELTEYVEPPRVNIEHDLVLATQVFSVAAKEAVWGMESRSKFVEFQEDGLSYDVFIDEARAIVRNLSRSGVVATN